MRINKWVIASCIIISILGVLMIVYFGNSAICVDIGISLLTGAIVSLVTSVLYYIYEWQDTVNSVKMVISSLYFDLLVIKRLTGSILPQVLKANLLADLNFRRLSGLSSEAYELVNSSKVADFSGLTKRCRTEIDLQDFRSLIGDVTNLRGCVYDVELLSLSADRFQLELVLKQNNGWQITPAEQELLTDKRNTVNVRTAKLHEYEASLLLRVDDLGKRFFRKRGESWEQIKILTEHSVDETTAHTNFLDSL